MSGLTRVTLALALVVGAACNENRVAGPRSTYAGGSTQPLQVQLPVPADVRASLVGGGKAVVISWSSAAYTDYAHGVAGFLVESASSEAGDWSIARFTNETTTGFDVTIGQQCYRVTAVAVGYGNANSAPSRAVCVGKQTS